MKKNAFLFAGKENRRIFTPVITTTNTTKMKNAIEFKNGLTVGKFQKTSEGFFDYTIEISGQTYFIGQPKRGKWAAYDEVEREYYAINNTRKDVVADIISGLYYQYKHSL